MDPPVGSSNYCSSSSTTSQSFGRRRGTPDHAAQQQQQQQQQPTNSNNNKQSTTSLWNQYVRLVRRNKSQLLLWESVLDRLLWWYPGQSQGSIWRQVLWSVAELQHLAIDLALQEPQQRQLDAPLTINDNGDDDHDATTTRNQALLALRIGLTVVHNLWPILYDRLQMQSSRRHSAYWQLQIESLRFICRLAIVLPHWWNMARRYPNLPPGLLQRGGLLSPAATTMSVVPPTACQQARRVACRAYIGRRTGRRVLQRGLAGGAGGHDDTTNNNNPPPRTARLWLGEMLHLVRPLFWAHLQYRYCGTRTTTTTSKNHGKTDALSNLWKSWLASLGLDVVSLVCLRQQQQHQGSQEINEATAAEWRRRGMRLLLYLLRAPCRDSVTLAATDKIHTFLAHVPLLGNLLSAYLQDWLYYWIVYRLEE